MANEFSNFYELTMHEDLHQIVWRPSEASSGSSIDQRPFEGIPKMPLFDRYTYQAAIQQDSIPGSIWDVMKKAGVGPKGRSPDRRTGVIVFDGDRIVASQTDAGVINPPQHTLFVDPEYRRKDIAQWLLIAWWKEFPRHQRLHPKQVFNQDVAAVAIAAWPKYLQLCQDEGKVVPQRVLDAVAPEAQWMWDRVAAAKAEYLARQPKKL